MNINGKNPAFCPLLSSMAASPSAEKLRRLFDVTASVLEGLSPALGLRKKEPWSTGAAMAAAG